MVFVMIEVQDIFQLYGDEYTTTHSVSIAQSKVLQHISQCRTAVLGGHIDHCPHCGEESQSYNSCRDRHCPKCQTFAKEKWLENKKLDLLNTGYFHVVFTVPSELNALIYQNQKIGYNLLFRCVSETLKQLASDKKYLGADIGFTSILHTWGQNLSFHPHLHVVVPGGGLNKVGKWQKSKDKFFLPIRVLSRKFRGKFLALLKESGISCPQDIIDSCYHKEWVVYCKPPFKSAAFVMEYLGRYTHRVAISNHRIVSCEDGKVTFRWRDYANHNKQKEMTISAHEFIRRFLMHVLPKGFMKIRHYGFLSSRGKQMKLPKCKQLTHTILIHKKLSTEELLVKLLGRKPSVCKCCGCDGIQRFRLSPPA